MIHKSFVERLLTAVIAGFGSLMAFAVISAYWNHVLSQVHTVQQGIR